MVNGNNISHVREGILIGEVPCIPTERERERERERNLPLYDIYISAAE